MHCGVLLGAAADTVVVVVVVVNAFVELVAEAFGRGGCCDPHAVTPAHAIVTIASSRIGFDISGRLRKRCRRGLGRAGSRAALGKSVPLQRRTPPCSLGSRHLSPLSARVMVWLATGRRGLQAQQQFPRGLLP
jgi:hypothetical protein